ncbi:MAG: superoxide dismutase family protein [Blautia obeum]|nr:superoxide dismutase family protein [Blautia obeum]
MFTVNHTQPIATAELKGGKGYESIHGKVDIYDTYEGSILIIEVYGIPKELEDKNGGFHGFHIHDGDSCTGNAKDPFANAGMHYNPTNQRHPYHAGDLPPLLSNKGTAWGAIYTTRFYPEDVIGKTVILHDKPDDFRTQPSGGSGEKIACGEIKACEKDMLGPDFC